ncbi:MAG: Methyltransferase type 12 [Bryobacterales bacterium]|nr:Methyltransferase type 12 [Bryobacterales bacterium]
MIAAPDAQTPTFRDPAGAVLGLNGRILRVVRPDSVADMEAFLDSRTAREAVQSGTLVSSKRLSPDAIRKDPFLNLDLTPEEALYEHERVPFPSYPYEWPAEMLHAAGVLTLDLALAALEDGYGLKDATPYNVLFRGPRPVFVDVLSFERRDPCDATWMAYAQFVRTFLLPLLADRDLGWPLQQTLSGRRDGLEPEAVYRSTGFLRRLARPYLEVVSLPTWLAAKHREDASLYRPKPAASTEQARYILRNLLNRCRSQLDAAGRQSRGDSAWSQYLDGKSLYSPEQLAEKEAFVREALELTRPATVLDAGANEGHFSMLAARTGAAVVAIDTDPVVVGSIWRRAHAENLDVQPLVVDLTRPTPASGWRNQECASFLDRAAGGFDLVLMLALMHHIVVTERIPLEELLALAAEISRDYMLIEFVAPEDPMFQRIVRGRQTLYSHLTKEHFETAAQVHWELVRCRRITGLHRWLYLYRRRRAKN